MKTVIISITLSAFICIGILLYFYDNSVVRPKIDKVELEPLDYSYWECNTQNVCRELYRYGVKFQSIVLAQMMLETGYFTSYNCRVRKNLTGMKGGEKTADNPQGYKIYKNWVYSVRGYLRWQRRHWNGEQDYYQFLDDMGYFESTNNYLGKLKDIESKIIIIKR